MTKAETKRVTATLLSEDYDRFCYLAKKRDMSINDLIKESITFYLHWEAGDYNLGTLEVQRLNQMIDVVQILSRNVKSLESVVTSGFDSLLNLTRGDNYLLEEEDGSL